MGGVRFLTMPVRYNWPHPKTLKQQEIITSLNFMMILFNHGKMRAPLVGSSVTAGGGPSLEVKYAHVSTQTA